MFTFRHCRILKLSNALYLFIDGTHSSGDFAHPHFQIGTLSYVLDIKQTRTNLVEYGFTRLKHCLHHRACIFPKKQWKIPAFLSGGQQQGKGAENFLGSSKKLPGKYFSRLYIAIAAFLRVNYICVVLGSTFCHSVRSETPFNSNHLQIVKFGIKHDTLPASNKQKNQTLKKKKINNTERSGWISESNTLTVVLFLSSLTGPCLPCNQSSFIIVRNRGIWDSTI